MILGLGAALSLAPRLPASAPPEPAAETLTLAEAIRRALAANPDLKAVRLGQGVSRSAIDVARQRPNPDLALEATRETPHESAVVSLPLEIQGRRARRIEVAEAEARTGDAEARRTELDLRNRVRRAFYALAAVERQAVERAGQLDLARRTRETAAALFEAGDVPQLDVLQADLGLAQAEADLAAVQGTLAAARTELNALLARPPEAPLAVAGELTEGELTPLAALASRALSANAELAALERRIAEQTARVALARAERYPAPVLSAGVTSRSPPELTVGWRAGLSFSLPILSRRRAEVEREEQVLAQRQAERDAARVRIAAAIAKAWATAETSRRQAATFRDRILPQSEQVERMAEDSYRSGQTGLPALLQALSATREARLKAIQAGLDYQTARAELEVALGAPLEDEPPGEEK